MGANDRNSRDLAIAPGMFLLVLDRTKGHVETLTGPSKANLSDTQVAVQLDKGSRAGYKEFDQPIDAVQANIVVRQGQYVVLHNPAKADEKNRFPESGKACIPPELDLGRVINLPGPQSFALWWQQRHEVIDGHTLRSNQFLVVEITSEEEARKNWKSAIFKKAETSGGSSEKSPEQQKHDAVHHNSIADLNPDKFTTGQRIIINGTDVSFFIPPTGMSVIRDPQNNLYVREAVTIESQQYCVLLGENGKKRYVQGPAVVFPTATESFIEEKGSRVFKCIELSPQSGIHVMVIEDYKEGDEVVKAGTELFITGKEEAIYFPRPQHAIVKHEGESFIHYATAVPEGEGRYVLDKSTGKVELRTGPDMLLLDPTRFVFVKRVLSQKQCELYFPGNDTVAQANNLMSERARAAGTDYLEGSIEEAISSAKGADYTAYLGGTTRSRAAGVSSAEVKRKNTYTPPRSVTLDTRYQGAVPIAIWPGYAVQVVKKNGETRTEVGPKTVLLAYDEELTRLALSSGKPKSTDRLVETVYLKLSGNQVSDIVEVETLDGIKIQVKIVLQVQFTGDTKLWFSVDNYVKQITDHVRSILRGAVKRKPVIDFNRDAVDIIRDAILGARVENKRPGCLFAQCGAQVYDVEVLGITITDQTVAKILTESQQQLVRGMIEVVGKQQQLQTTKAVQEAERGILTQLEQTAEAQHQAAMSRLERQQKARETEQDNAAALEAARQTALQELQPILSAIAAEELKRKEQSEQLSLKCYHQKQQIASAELEAETKAIKERLEAIDAQLAEAFNASTNRETLVEVAKSLGVAAYLNQDNLPNLVQKLFSGTPLEKTLNTMKPARTVAAK